MICALLSDDLPESLMDEVIGRVAQQARAVKSKLLTIVFLSNNVNKVFIHRDVFTKHVDIGVRVYVENEVKRLKDILKSCISVQTSPRDHKAIEVLKNLESIKIVYTD